MSLGENNSAVAAFAAAAAAAGIELKVVTYDDEEVSDLYESELVLIRPDQIVAWRSTGAAFNAADVLGNAIGHSDLLRVAA